MDSKIIIKQEACFLERASTEVTHGSDVHVKSEASSFASVFIVQPDCDTHSYYHEVGAKIQVKEEAVSLEGIPSELNTNSEEIHVKDADMQDSSLQRDHDFILPESSRLDTQAVGRYESGVVSAGSDKNCLKLRENSTPCHETSSINPVDESGVTETDPHKCKYCGRCFYLPSQLQTHVEAHESKKKHKCSVCDKKFLTASRLKRHSFIHAGIRPFKCDKCEKSFTISSNLSRHKLYHEGKRPHKCDRCEKTFTEASHLKTHNLIHEGKRPFKCSKCDKSFTTSSNLKTHNLFHEGKKPHKCETCEKSYILASHLKNHRTLIHGDKKPQKSEISKDSFILGF